MHLPVKVWHDDEAWYAEVVTIPQAHVCGGSRDEVMDAIQHVIADLREHSLLHETAELASVEA